MHVMQLVQLSVSTPLHGLCKLWFQGVDIVVTCHANALHVMHKTSQLFTPAVTTYVVGMGASVNRLWSHPQTLLGLHQP